MSWDPRVPYDDLPDVPPPIEVETKTVLKAAIEARAALARLDQAADLLANPTVLLNVIPLLEAQASSEIENIMTTADELFRYSTATATATDPSTKEALRYRSALLEGVAAIRSRPLTARTATRICSAVQGREMALRRVPGTRIGNPATGRVVYSPPQGAAVIADRLANWERFVHGSDSLDPLVRMAIAHYQFEAIHPYADGNGRTGRILNILMLIEAGLIRDPILYLSRFIIANKVEYYRLLRAVTSDGAWEPWIVYMLAAVTRTATSTVSKIAAVRTLQSDVARRARSATTGGRNSDLLAVLFAQPYCRIADVVKRCDVSRPTATGWLNDLVEHGILTDLRIGRERLFLHTAFLDVLVREDDDDGFGSVVHWRHE